MKISELIHNSKEPCFVSQIELKRKLSKTEINAWYTKKPHYIQGKLKLHTSLKESPGFEQYLNLRNPKLWQTINKIRVSAHKFPIETGQCENKNSAERFCPLCCENIGDECLSLITCKSKEIFSVINKIITPFFHNWKGTNKISNEEFCRAILSCQNDDIASHVGLLCLKIQEVFKEQALQNHHY